MLVPTIPGWKAETVGDDICWMKFGDDGRLYAINPEAGFFGVAPGTGYDTNPNAMDTLWGNCDLHQHRAHRRRRRVVGGHDRQPAGPRHRLEGQPVDARDRRRRPPTRTPASRRPASQCPSIAPEWEDPAGVPISAILFGGRRRTTVPLVTEAFDWEHGVFLGSIMASETTAAQQGAVGKLRFDPMAMLPFCGYNMADYFAHWLAIGKATDPNELPRIFFVNWFRRDADGRFLWPGFGENSRVLKWVFERVDGQRRRGGRHADRAAADGDVARHDRARHRRRRPGDAAVRRRRRLARRDPADPRALRPVRRPPPRPTGDGSRHARSPPELKPVTVGARPLPSCVGRRDRVARVTVRAWPEPSVEVEVPDSEAHDEEAS